MIAYDTNPQTMEDYIAECDNIETRKRLFGKNYIYRPTSSAMKMYTFYIETSDAERCIDAIKSDPQLFSGLHRVNSGNCRLQVMLSNDHKAALIQLSRYVPHTYEPRINPVLLTGDQVTPLISLIKA